MYVPHASVAGELQLSQSDRDAVAQVISRRTIQKIAFIFPGPEKATISVWCGYYDQLSRGQRLKGDNFILKKSNGQWTVIGKAWWVTLKPNEAMQPTALSDIYF